MIRACGGLGLGISHIEVFIKLEFKPNNVAWAAGLFEGEGCWGTRMGSRRRYWYPYSVLKMTDQDVVERFKKIVGVGSIYALGIPKGGKKPQWKWRIGSFEHVQHIAALFWPWLGIRRKTKVKEILISYQKETEGRVRRKKVPY